MGNLSDIKGNSTGHQARNGRSGVTLLDQVKSSDTFYIAGIQEERAVKDHFFRMDPLSPIIDRANFPGLDYYPPNPAYIYTLVLQSAKTKTELAIQTNTGDKQLYYRLGTIEFEVKGEVAKLAIYQSLLHEELFLPFRDATSGKETYAAGRYLEPQDLGDGTLLVDFNLCYNPLCVYNNAYSCPLPPLENHLQVAIRAGEKAFHR